MHRAEYDKALRNYVRDASSGMAIGKFHQRIQMQPPWLGWLGLLQSPKGSVGGEPFGKLKASGVSLLNWSANRESVHGEPIGPRTDGPLTGPGRTEDMAINSGESIH